MGLVFGHFSGCHGRAFQFRCLVCFHFTGYEKPVSCLIVGTLGNWLGGITTYWIGRIGRWEWVEKWFKVKRETLEKHKAKVDKYGVWLALISWVPIVGDVFVIALGFYKARPGWTMLLMLIGKFLRFWIWSLIIGAI